MLLFWGLLIAGIVMLARCSLGSKGCGKQERGETALDILKKPRVGRIGDVFFHRRDIHPHGRRDPLVVSELVPDERLNLLRSFRTQSFPELAQRGTLYKMGLFRKNASENHPHHVLVEPLHNLLIRQVEPVFQDHEADHQPGWLGGTACT